MGFKARAKEPNLLYEEKQSCSRRRRYCLKPVNLVETKAAKDVESVNIQFSRGNKTNINIDCTEEKKIHEHFEFVIKKLQKMHKSVMWNMYIGRSFLKKNESNIRAQEELDVDDYSNNEFDINNAASWNKDCITHIEETLRVNEVPSDGIVCLFSIANNDSEPDIDDDEVAWEIEKVVLYYTVNTYIQRVLNQEGCMARQGIDPISRKVRTQSRDKTGYVVYLSYQLVTSVTFNQVMVETVLYAVDIELKKKHLLHQLGDLRMSPPVDDRNRKVIKDVKDFMMKEQVEILHQVLISLNHISDSLNQGAEDEGQGGAIHGVTVYSAGTSGGSSEGGCGWTYSICFFSWREGSQGKVNLEIRKIIVPGLVLSGDLDRENLWFYKEL